LGGDRPNLVFCRGADATAISDRVYNPDYLVAVQRAHGGMAPYFEAWRAVAPDMETVVLPGANHFEMLGDAATLKPLADLIAAQLNLDAPAPVPPATAPEREKDRLSSSHPAARNSAIAVIGLSGRFPGADTTDEFYRLLLEGRSAITPLPLDRGWSVEGCDATHGGFLDGIDQFDPVFFRIPPKVAETLDPAERLFLMEGWRAIEDTGTDPVGLAGANWGVFCGGGGDYTLRIMDLTGVSPHVTQSSIPARLAYSLNLAGPSVSVDAGCASSLLAVAQACDQLLLGRCDVAVAGGVMVHSTPNLIRSDVGPGVLSRGAECHALDERADGMLPGEAVAAVVLKPLDRALADGDRIHGVIEGWGNNHSGRTNGMAAPSTRAQAALMKRVHAEFGIDVATIGVIEANATGTPLGDAVEIEALGEVFTDTPLGRPRLLGTVENNIGHAYHASGMAHLFKVLLSMRYGTIPGTRSSGRSALPSPSSVFEIHDDSAAWPSSVAGPQCAAVNSVGATGTNVHLVLSPAPEDHRPRVPVRPRRAFDLRRCWIEEGSQELKLSGRNGTAESLVSGLVEDLTGYDASDISYEAPLSSFGLDSLMSMRLLALINDKCGLALQLADLAEHDSVDALARLIETAAPEHYNLEKKPAARPVLSDEQHRAAGWFAERLSALPDSLDAVVKPLSGGSAASEQDFRSALAALSAAGIAAYRAGPDIHLIAGDSATIEAASEALSPAETISLAALPEGTLHAPCSDEQNRALYHSERIGSLAWNVTQIFTLSEDSLDHVALGGAVAAAGRHYDLLRTRFEAVEGETERWLQVVERRAPEMLEIVDVQTSSVFYERVAGRRLTRIAVDRLPVARFMAAWVDGRCLLAVVIHHALADAFAPPILFERIRRDYESLRVGSGEAADGEGECYWHYAISQSGRDPAADGKALDHWCARFDGIGASMRLPYAKAPESVDRDAREVSDGHMLVFTPELADAVGRFSRTHGYSFTQLFTAAVVLTLREAGNPVPVVRYLHSRRDRLALLDMPGEFSNVLFLPFDIAPELSVRDLLEAVKQETLEGLRASRLPFGQLCGAAGIDGPEACFRDTGDVMIDSAVIESLRHDRAAPAFALAAIDIGSGVRATTTGPEPGAQEQTAASLFFQLLKMGERVEIVTTWRRALFEPAEMRQLTALIVQLMTQMMHAPQADLESLVKAAAEPLSALRARTDRFAAPTPPLARPRKPKTLTAEILHATQAVPGASPPFFAECQRVNPVTEGRPVFWVHGAFGDASVYRKLATRLDRPFYGLQARGLIDGKVPLSGVETIAAFYTDMIRTIQPHGPYDLGGYSVGGTFAYEIARQLQAAGEHVDSLTLADPIFAPLHTHLGSGLYDLYAFLATGLIAMAGGADAAAVPWRDDAREEAEIIDDFIAYCRAAGVNRPESWIRDYLARMAAIQKGFRITEYEPQPLERPVACACYFRNRSGWFFGDGGRNGGENPDPLDGVDYWSAWADLLPGLEYRTVEIDSHLELFESPSALDAISEYCLDIYGGAKDERTEDTSEKLAEGFSPEDVAALVADILERPAAEIAPNRPLTDYGMDSLLATRLLQQFRERFGADLDLATMATLHTLDDLTAALGHAPARKAKGSAGNPVDTRSLDRRHPELVRLNHGVGRPVFWFHGGLGSVEAYRGLAEHCPRPLWGIQARGWMTDREPLHGVAAMACYYVQVIQAVQSKGPYDLGGYSLGGVLAYEVTRQLQELGERVESIVMVDSYDVTDNEPSPLFTKRCMLGAVNMALQSGLSEDCDLEDRLVSAAEIDPGLNDDEYWSRLIALAGARGLKRTESQLRTTVKHMTKFGRALEGDGFRILPLPDRDGVRCHYFRNAGGRFYGDLESFFTFPGTNSVFKDSTDHWRGWAEHIPDFSMRDVPSPDHTTMLSDPASAQEIIGFCGELYR
jgi:thioesterase domain-containing protein/3-oxoacyl-(acyl-carrier-protein) synthase/acyl carrier protein